MNLFKSVLRMIFEVCSLQELEKVSPLIEKYRKDLVGIGEVCTYIFSFISFLVFYIDLSNATLEMSVFNRLF